MVRLQNGKNILKLPLKWGQGHLIILKYLHIVILCKLVQDYYNLEIVLILLDVKTIATNANSNVDVIVCFT